MICSVHNPDLLNGQARYEDDDEPLYDTNPSYYDVQCHEAMVHTVVNNAVVKNTFMMI